MNATLNKSESDWQLLSFDFGLGPPLSTAEQNFRFTIIGAGLLVNFFLLVVSFASRQLLYPRNLFWIAIGFVNIFYLVQSIIEIFAIMYQNKLASQLFIFNAGVGYSLFIVSLALAAFDRYLAIAHSEWYKSKVTNKVAIIGVSGMVMANYIGITSPFWTGFKNLSNCTINMTHMHWVFVWDLLMGIVCVVLHVQIFMKSRAIIRQYPSNLNPTPIIVQFHTTNNCRRMNSHCEYIGDIPNQHVECVLETDVAEAVPAQSAQVVSQASQFEEENCFPWLPHFQPKINRLEVRAALNLSINTMPFLILTFPVSCNSIALYWCIRFEMNCSIFIATNPYLRNMFLFHAIYNPVMYMLYSLEFRRALKRFIKKLFPSTCTYGL